MKKLVNIKDISHDEWLELRKKSIGGSEAGTVKGENPWGSEYGLYCLKKGLVKPIETTEAMRLGTDLEDYVAKRYVEKTGNEVRNDNFMYQHDEYPFITANLDRRIVGQNAGLECKTMSSFNGYDLANGEVPPHYFAQCQHYMMVMGFDYVDLAVMVFQRGVYVLHIERDDEYIKDLLDAEIDFWKNHIEANVPPEVSDKDEDVIGEVYPTAEVGSEMEISDELIEKYLEASEQEKVWKDQKKLYKNEITALLGEKESGIGTEYSCTWKNQTRHDFDTTRFKAEQPKLYKQYVKESVNRTFRAKKNK